MDSQLDLMDKMSVSRDLAEVQRRRNFNDQQPICRVPLELKVMILAHLKPYDGLNLAKACSAWGVLAGEEVLRLDSRFGDRQGLSRACCTNNLALLNRALGLGASPNDVFPWDRGMSGLNPLALAITSGCSPEFIRTLLSTNKITQEALNNSRNGNMSPGATHFWTDTPLQMALLRAHPKAADPERNPWWYLEHPGTYSHYQIPRQSKYQEKVYWFTKHLSNSSMMFDPFGTLQEHELALSARQNDRSRSPPLTREAIEQLKRSEIEQLEALKDVVEIANMLIDHGARTSCRSAPTGPFIPGGAHHMRPVCDTIHLPAQYRYHHHGHYFVQSPQVPNPAPVAHGLSYHRRPPRWCSRTPAFLAVTLAELDHKTVLPLLRRILVGIESAPAPGEQVVFRARHLMWESSVLWAIMTRRRDALNDKNKAHITSEQYEGFKALNALLNEFQIVRIFELPGMQAQH
ncbi:hypothetical protein V8F20_003458 [Naviculisporaceae sp. PSN 640]